MPRLGLLIILASSTIASMGATRNSWYPGTRLPIGVKRTVDTKKDRKYHTLSVSDTLSAGWEYDTESMDTLSTCWYSQCAPQRVVLRVRVWHSHAESIILSAANSGGYKKNNIGNCQYCQFTTLVNSTSPAPPIGLPPKMAKFCHTSNRFFCLVGHGHCHTLLQIFQLIIWQFTWWTFGQEDELNGCIKLCVWEMDFNIEVFLKLQSCCC